MMREVLAHLDLHPGQTVVDGTVGAGGHSEQILKHIGQEGTLIGLDRDPAMLAHAGRRLQGSNCRLVHASYSQLAEVLETNGIERVDRILLDLGLSSDQLADEERGFGYRTAGSLDLRFDTSQGQPAWKLIENSSAEQLTHIFEEYGEERFARQIAEQLIARRKDRPVKTAADLVEAVAESVPAKFQREARTHSATRVFQALRIAVNEELTHLQTALERVLPQSLVPGGRLVVISFHSLEDRLVKQTFRDKQQWQNLTSRPVCASALEVRMNPRSRTAKLRAAAKI
jgi:16S rRNA (cytosine1402-N4)-methyltransferase